MSGSLAVALESEHLLCEVGHVGSSSELKKRKKNNVAEPELLQNRILKQLETCSFVYMRAGVADLSGP